MLSVLHCSLIHATLYIYMYKYEKYSRDKNIYIYRHEMNENIHEINKYLKKEIRLILLRMSINKFYKSV